MIKSDFIRTIDVMIKARLYIATLAMCCVLLPSPSTAEAIAAEHVTVQLLVQRITAPPATRVWVWLKFVHEPHWHTYWINPGDAGLPTQLVWELPKGFQVGAIEWPTPKRFDLSGLYNFGYDGTVLLPVPIDVPANAQLGTTAHLVLKTKWLICSDQCIPGEATTPYDLIIANTPSRTLLAPTIAAKPQRVHWQGQARVTGDKGDAVRIKLQSSELRNSVVTDVFPTANKMLSNAPPKITRKGEQLIIDTPINDYFESAPDKIDLVLVGKDHNGNSASWQVSVPWLQATNKIR